MGSRAVPAALDPVPMAPVGGVGQALAVAVDQANKSRAGVGLGVDGGLACGVATMRRVEQKKTIGNSVFCNIN